MRVILVQIIRITFENWSDYNFPMVVHQRPARQNCGKTYYLQFANIFLRFTSLEKRQRMKTMYGFYSSPLVYTFSIKSWFEYPFQSGHSDVLNIDAECTIHHDIRKKAVHK